MEVAWKQNSLAPWVAYAKTRLEIGQQLQCALASKSHKKKRRLCINSSDVTRECSPARPITQCENRPKESALWKSVKDLKSSVRELKENFKYSSLCSTRHSSPSHSSRSQTQTNSLSLPSPSTAQKRSAFCPFDTAELAIDSSQLPCSKGDFSGVEVPARKTFAKVNTLIPAKMSELVKTVCRSKDGDVWYLRVEVTEVKCQTLEPPLAELTIGKTAKAPCSHSGFRIYPSLSQASAPGCALMQVQPESLHLSETGAEAPAVLCLALVHAPKRLCGKAEKREFAESLR